jgi:peptidoglycan/xylan/chitin deacetylase (PgdA/CDA1 family)
MYHEVTETAHPPFAKYSVTPRAFAAQMRWLASANYSTISLPTLITHRTTGAAIPRRPIIITFDDGFLDCARHAGPTLAAHGFSATFFLVAGLTGGPSTWLRAERGIELPLMSWDDARALERDGHHCESHSMTHPRLAELSADACREELARSRAVIEEELQHEVRCLAYPFGSYTERVREIAAACGYEAACTVEQGLSTSDDHPLALKRVPVLGGDSLFDFISRLSTAHTVGDRLSAFAQNVMGSRGSAK